MSVGGRFPKIGSDVRDASLTKWITPANTPISYPQCGCNFCAVHGERMKLCSAACHYEVVRFVGLMRFRLSKCPMSSKYKDRLKCRSKILDTFHVGTRCLTDDEVSRIGMHNIDTRLIDLILSRKL